MEHAYAEKQGEGSVQKAGPHHLALPAELPSHISAQAVQALSVHARQLHQSGPLGTLAKQGCMHLPVAELPNAQGQCCALMLHIVVVLMFHVVVVLLLPTVLTMHVVYESSQF